MKARVTFFFEQVLVTDKNSNPLANKHVFVVTPMVAGLRTIANQNPIDPVVKQLKNAVAVTNATGWATFKQLAFSRGGQEGDYTLQFMSEGILPMYSVFQDVKRTSAT